MAGPLHLQMAPAGVSVKVSRDGACVRVHLPVKGDVSMEMVERFMNHIMLMMVHKQAQHVDEEGLGI